MKSVTECVRDISILYHRCKVQGSISTDEYFDEMAKLLDTVAYHSQTITGHTTETELLKSLSFQARNEGGMRLDQRFTGMVLRTAKQFPDPKSPTGTSFALTFHAPVVDDPHYIKDHLHTIEMQESKKLWAVATMKAGTVSRMRAGRIFGCKRNPCPWHDNSEAYLVYNSEEDRLVFEEE